MPRANNFALLDCSFPERTANVEANVVHRAELAVHVRNADGLFAAGEFFGSVGGGKFRFAGDLREGHSLNDIAVRGSVWNENGFLTESPLRFGMTSVVEIAGVNRCHFEPARSGGEESGVAVISAARFARSLPAA
jgi:hypothetical protein